MKYEPIDNLTNCILSSIIKKTGAWLASLESEITPHLQSEDEDTNDEIEEIEEEVKTISPPDYYEGIRFTWKLDPNEPTILVGFKNVYTGDLVKLYWNGLFKEDFRVESNIQISANTDLSFFVKLEDCIYSELREKQKAKDALLNEQKITLTNRENSNDD